MFGRKRIKQFGLQRTGSNFLKYLLEFNYRVRLLTNEGGWKHGFYTSPLIIPRELDCIVTCKDIYSWLTSMYRYFHWHDLQDKPKSFDDFLKSRFVLRGRVIASGRSYQVTMRASNPIEHWNNMNYHWTQIELKRKKVKILRYEDLLADPPGCTASLASDLGLTRKNRGPVIVPDKKMNPAPSVMSSKNALSDEQFSTTEYYLEKRYMEEYSDAQLHYVSAHVDKELAHILGYEITA